MKGSRLAAGLLCLVLAGLNGLAWQWANRGQPAAEAGGPVEGLAYNAFGRWQDPVAQSYPSAQAVAQDLEVLRRTTRRIRTYSTAESPELPAMAERLGLQVMAGAWLQADARRHGAEIEALVKAVRASGSIHRVIIGNETQLHRTVDRQTLVSHLQAVRSRVAVPVSTAEPWHVWLADPDLAESVDFIAVHLLPYWEGVPSAVAVHEVWRRYDELVRRFPGKAIVIAEVGWPSEGSMVEARTPEWLNRATASPIEQARFLREFVASAARRDPAVEYYLMEAIDQPWKAASEGPAGAHWGVLDARRQAKFNWTGPVEHNPYWRGQAVAAITLAVLLTWPFLVRMNHLRWSARVAFGVCAQAVATFTVVLLTLPLVHYLHALDIVLMALLVPAISLMLALVLCQLFEFAELYWEGGLQRRAAPKSWPAEQPTPWVSIHLPCCNEPADMVIQTVASLQRLDWPTLEIIVVDNNSDDERCWRPVQAYMEQARIGGDTRLRFIRLPRWPGFKGGALNAALAQTDPRAEWVGVVDADYVVDPGWLWRIAGHFTADRVAVVQAPQAHRDGLRSRLSRMMDSEYDAFFRLGMHHRHERDAIVQHGTMTVIRSRALLEVGGWATDCICEDTELGLRLLRAGWSKVYVDEVLGRGLVPQDFAAYRRQRQRWAQGGMQILRKHARALLTLRPQDQGGDLSLGQRYHFLAGWLPWWADTLHLMFTLTALGWTLGMIVAPHAFFLPGLWLAAPLLGYLLTRAVLLPLLYRKRVSPLWGRIAGASWVGMALSHAIARGVLRGLLTRGGTFHVTRKGAEQPGPLRPAAPQAPWFAVREEALLLAGLMLAAAALWVGSAETTAQQAAWMALLLLQSLPYAAALSCARR